MKTPEQHLREISATYKNSLRSVETFLEGRRKDLPAWPRWCFLPMAAWYAMVTQEHGWNPTNPPLLIGAETAKLAALGTWRYTQGVYRFPAPLLEELAASALTGDLPSETFLRLPEWCVYVATPGMSWCGMSLAGFWALLEWDANTHRQELRLLLHMGDSLVPVIVHLGAWTIEEGVNRMIAVAKGEAEKRDVKLRATTETAKVIATEVAPLLSLLLYLCSEEPEIENNKNPGSGPANAKRVKTKSGWRLFPAPGPKIFEVGKSIGKILEEARTKNESARSIRAHVRRGHWHSYRVGLLRKHVIVKWLHPFIVRGGKT